MLRMSLAESVEVNVVNINTHVCFGDSFYRDGQDAAEQREAPPGPLQRREKLIQERSLVEVKTGQLRSYQPSRVERASAQRLTGGRVLLRRRSESCSGGWRS